MKDPEDYSFELHKGPHWDVESIGLWSDNPLFNKMFHLFLYPLAGDVLNLIQKAVLFQNESVLLNKSANVLFQ